MYILAKTQDSLSEKRRAVFFYNFFAKEIFTWNASINCGGGYFPLLNRKITSFTTFGRGYFPLQPENYIVHNLRTSLSVAEHQRDTALTRLAQAETELIDVRTKHQCLVQNLQLVAKGQYQAVYENIKDSLDQEGWTLYRAAEHRCKTSVHEFFSTEDNMGCFEAMDGTQLLPWLECANFGTCDWRQLDCPGGYEVSENRRINTASEEYINYRKEIFEEAVNELLLL